MDLNIDVTPFWEPHVREAERLMGCIGPDVFIRALSVAELALEHLEDLDADLVVTSPTAANRESVVSRQGFYSDAKYQAIVDVLEEKRDAGGAA